MTNAAVGDVLGSGPRRDSLALEGGLGQTLGKEVESAGGVIPQVITLPEDSAAQALTLAPVGARTDRSMELTRTLATNLRVLRELRGRLGQLELAQKIGVSRRTIARLENAEVADPGVEQLRSLAHALRVPLDLLISRRLVAVSIPVPHDIRDRLEGDEGPSLLAKLVQLVDDVPKPDRR